MTDREKLIVAIERAKEQSDEVGLDCIVVKFKEANLILELLKNQPEQKFFVNSDGKITPLPIQKHGHWIPVKLPTGVGAFGYKEYTVQEVICSECRFTEDVMASSYSYCPHCGTKMDEKVKQE